jgi:Ni,Fe-hydrogenase III large subunit
MSTPRTETEAKAAAERILQTLLLVDQYHEQLRQQFKRVERDDAVHLRLAEFGLLDRVEALAREKGLGLP